MKVALDAQLALGTATGIGEYVRGLAGALRAAGTEVVELCEPKLDPWRFDRRILWDQIILPQRALDSKADVLHCASGTMPIRRSLPTVVTVHDVAWLKVQAHARTYARYYFGSFALQRYRRAGALVVDSAFSRAELLQALDIPPDRVHVIYPGVAPDFCRLEHRSHAPPILLVPGTVERRKNLEVLIRSLPALPQLRLVSVGPFTAYRQECERLAREQGVEQRVEFRGYVSRDALLELYRICALVAVPSHYEGFGYAAAQALCAGVPVLVSDRSSLPEVAAGDAPAVAADDVAAWTHALAAILNDRDAAQIHASEVRERAIARFAWSASAASISRLYENVLTK